MEVKPSQHSSSNALRRMGRIFIKILIGILAFFIVIILLIQAPPVQNFARKKIVAFLENKLKTRVEIGKINIGIPNKILLENIYIEDRQKDTLLSGERISADINMFKLISSNVVISELEVRNVTAKIKRILPDTVYNFQFIVDAFAPKNPTAANPADTAAFQMDLDEITLDKIRLVYNDAVSGSDMDIWLEHFDTDVKTFDLNKQVYSVPVSNINGLRARIYQRKPLVQPQPLSQDMAEAAQPTAFVFDFDEFNLKDISLDYRNDVSAFYTDLNLGSLIVTAENVDFKNQVITLDELQLNKTSAVIRLGKKEAAKEVVKQVEQEVQSQAQKNWKFVVSKIRLNDNNIQFDNDNMPRVSGGMDYAHLKAEGLTLHANNFVFTMDSIAGEITKGQVTEQSGFQLNTLETKFMYAAKGAYLEDLLIETPGSVIRRSAAVQYPSMEALQKDIGLLQMDIDLDNSKIQAKDILVFAPQLRSQPAFRNPSAVWFVNGRVTGSVANMRIHELQFRGLQNTRVDLNGTINGLPDMNRLNTSLAIREFTTTKSDLQSVLPPNTIPANITLPDRVDLNGNIVGNMASLKTDLDIRTNLGSASVDGTFGNLTTPENLKYNAAIAARGLNLGKILQNEESFGTVTANVTAIGQGTDPKTAYAEIKGVVESAVINKYNYTNVQLNATIAKQQLVADLNVNDPNIDLDLNAKSDLSAEFPSVQISASIDSIKTLPLNLTPEALVYRGNITGNFPVTDPKNLQGELLITNSILVTNNQRFVLDSIDVKAGKSDSGQFINVRSDAINASLTGQYNLAQIASVIQQTIQPYYTLVPNYKPVPVDPYDFSLNAQVINGPLLKVFVPGLQQLEPVSIKTHFANQGFQANINSPLIVFNGNRLENITLDAGTGPNGIMVNVAMQKFGSGTAMNLYATNVNAVIANNRINFMVGIKDKNANNKYTLGGMLDQPEPGVYALALRPDSLLLNYTRWTLAQNNLIRFNSNTGDINVSNFILGKDAQQLSIQSTSTAVNSPLQVNFSNFRIGTITGFLKQDTLLADGSLNGQVVLSNITQQPTFTSDITITDLTVMKDTVGNLALKVNNTTPNVFTATGTLSGKGNDVALNGQYFLKPANQSVYDLTVDIRQLQMSSITAASMGALVGGAGFINGKISINGTFEKPAVIGNLTFNQARFTPTMLGSYFMIDQETININQAGFLFDTFTIRDSVNNSLVVDGYAYTSNFINYRFDLNIDADNFQAINTTKRDHALYYGKFYFDSDLRVRGTETSPVIDGAITVNESTDFTVVMPQQEPGLAEREGIVRFVDMDSVRMDTTGIFASYDSLNTADLVGLDVTVNIEVNREATFSLVVDEANGDFVRMKGEAQLTGGIDKSGKVTLTGSYEIEEGAYEISINLLKRKFSILKGSKIIWLGEPTRADIDVTAVYIANTSPLTLVEQGLDTRMNTNYFKQKIPFEVHLQLEGQLLRPEISFDIKLPENHTYSAGNVDELVEARLAQLRQDPSELNKQVFAVLLFNRFVNENPFESGGGGGFNAGMMARQSVSKLLAEQLNDLAEDLIAGVEVNFDIQSFEDYSTGTAANRTDLNVSLSKQLLNDRLKVTVGNNFELEGPQPANGGGTASGLAGNIALDYQLSRDGKYMIRAFRKNEYEGQVEGYIIETGVTFIITLDYNHFRDLFRKKKKQPAQPPPTLPPPADGNKKDITPAPEAKLNDE